MKEGDGERLYGHIVSVNTCYCRYAANELGHVEELISKMKPLFDGFAELMHLARTCRVLLDVEVEQLCSLRTSVPRKLRALVTNGQIKTHMVEFEMPAFVRRWRTIVVFCEEKLLRAFTVP